MINVTKSTQKRTHADRAWGRAHRVVGLLKEREEAGVLVVFKDLCEVGVVHRDVRQQLPIVGAASLVDVAEKKVKHLPYRARGKSSIPLYRRHGKSSILPCWAHGRVGGEPAICS